jgi:hypothetical protein
MLIFLRILVSKVYYGTILFGLSCAYRYYWKKTLYYKEKRDVRYLAYYFRRAHTLKERIELTKLKKQRRINDYETLS